MQHIQKLPEKPKPSPKQRPMVAHPGHLGCKPYLLSQMSLKLPQYKNSIRSLSNSVLNKSQRHEHLYSSPQSYPSILPKMNLRNKMCSISTSQQLMQQNSLLPNPLSEDPTQLLGSSTLANSVAITEPMLTLKRKQSIEGRGLQFC